MRYSPVETFVLIVSVLKWVVLAAFVGLFVGILSSIFLLALKLVETYVCTVDYYYLLLPLALLICPWLVKRFCPEAKGHGTEKVIEAIHKKKSLIRTKVIPVKFLATLLTIAFGGSVGKEGPAAQMGAAAAAAFAKICRFTAEDRRKIVICGISASFAAVFGTPFGGALFGVEVLFVGSIMYAVLLPSIISGIVAHKVTVFLGVPHMHYLHVSENAALNQNIVNAPLFMWVVAGGIFFGLCSILFVEILEGSEKLSGRIKLPAPLKGVLAGVFLIILTLIFSTKYLGLGMNTINASLDGATVVWYAFLMKMLFTAVTLSFGGSGGLVTPLFFIGATAGTTFAMVCGLDMQLFAALGMVAVLAGATNTPVACSVIGIELLGREVAPYAAAVCVISFLITGYRSVYPSQVLAIIKSSSMGAEVGREMNLLMPSYKPRKKSFITMLLIRLRVWRRKKRRTRTPR